MATLINSLSKTTSLAMLALVVGLTGCGIPTWHGGPNIFEKFFGCPDCPGELSCKCVPDPYCFGYNPTNWKELGPECNETVRATEAVAARENLATAMLERQMIREEDNVPSELLFPKLVEPSEAAAILQNYEEPIDHVTAGELLNVQNNYRLEDEIGCNHCSACDGGCDSCSGSSCSLCTADGFGYDDAPGQWDGQGPFLIEKIMGCQDCPGPLACKCHPDGWCAGYQATNWRTMGGECNETEAGVSGRRDHGLDSSTTESESADAPPQPPIDIAEPQDPNGGLDETVPMVPPETDTELYPERPDETPVPTDDVPDLFPKQDRKPTRDRRGIAASEQTPSSLETLVSQPSETSPQPNARAALRSNRLGFGPGLRNPSVSPVGHDEPIE